MESKEIITDDHIEFNLQIGGWYQESIDEGRLMLVELLSKAAAGYYNSNTEERLLKSFGLMLKSRLPNKNGRRFICSMIYKHSNKKAEIHDLISKYRS